MLASFPATDVVWGVFAMLRVIAALAVCAGAISAPAFARDKGMIVVTGQRMVQDASDDALPVSAFGGGEPPFVSVTIPADYVIFTVSIESGTRADNERNQELERTFAAAAARVSRDKTVTMEVGSPGDSAPLETTTPKEVIQDAGDRSIIPVVLKFATKPSDTFEAVRTRAEKFIAAIEANGRTELVTGDLQYIGVTEPKKHREALLRKIAEDTRLLQSIFGTPAAAPIISLTGLEGRVRTRPSGPLEMEMYIPYTINLSSPQPR